MNFETIVGIEIHVEMKTKSKMFSLAPISFGLKPNTEENQILRLLLLIWLFQVQCLE